MLPAEVQAKTQEVANKLVEYVRSGKWSEATEELYSENIVSIEPERSNAPTRLEGKDAKRGKDKQFTEMVEEYHSNECSDPVVAAPYFSVSMNLDCTFKGMGRMQMNEICVYRVDSDGKIDYEEFFFATPSES